MYPTLLNALRETLVMVGFASLITIIVGVPIGILTAALATSHNKLLQGIHYLLLGSMQFARIMPYLLLMLFFIPLSNWFIDHKISYTNATVVPLATAGAFLLAYKVYLKIQDVTQHWSTTAKALGATPQQSLWLIIIPECTTDIIKNCASVCSLIVGFSAVAGALGAGGLGQLAIERSINEPDPLLVILCISLLIAMQQMISLTGNLVAAKQGK